MKRISTFKAIAICALMFAVQATKAQTLTILNNSCNTANWTDTIGFNDLTSSTLGFLGGWTKTFQGSDGYLDISTTSGNTYSITTPTYIYGSSTILLSFAVGGSASVSSATIAVETATSSATTIGTISGPVNGKYCLQISNFNSYVGQRARFVITFTTSSNGNSGNGLITFDNWATNFSIAAAALPVNFIGLEAKKLANGTQLTWKVAQESDVVNYDLERSADGRNFTKVGSVDASGASSYSLTDYSVTSSTVYYRVKNNDRDARFKYSTTLKVEGGVVSFLKRAYPMPASSEVFIQHDAAGQNAVITLSTQDGRMVKRIAAQAGAMQTRIDLSGLNSGLYFVKYDNGTGNAETLKVVKQ